MKITFVEGFSCKIMHSELWQLLKMLKALFHSNRSIASKLDKEWREEQKDSVNRWKILVDELKSAKKETLIDEIQLQFSYPRLDVNVTRGVNHLLKSPLCIHPKTGQGRL